VVEATRRSGALITADHALALGRDVLAVPGAPWLDLGVGTLGLLRAGAAPVGGAADVVDALGVQMEVEPTRGEPPAGGRRALGRAPSPPPPPRRLRTASRRR
jgi:DNA processing protein